MNLGQHTSRKPYKYFAPVTTSPNQIYCERFYHLVHNWRIIYGENYPHWRIHTGENPARPLWVKIRLILFLCRKISVGVHLWNYKIQICFIIKYLKQLNYQPFRALYSRKSSLCVAPFIILFQVSFLLSAVSSTFGSVMLISSMSLGFGP